VPEHDVDAGVCDESKTLIFLPAWGRDTAIGILARLPEPGADLEIFAK